MLKRRRARGSSRRGAWWRGAVIYQIYARSFADSNGDGVGDLAGIIGRLDHVANLGVDAIWLNPIYPSGGADGGYDVVDYQAVDPVYGDLATLDRLLRDAHGRGLRVLMDFVPNHTSERHPWFLESRSSGRSPMRDWYIWADGRGGGQPNNWSSVFTGPAWVFDQPTGQYYLASFYPEQPDLNWHNPEVRRAMIGAMKFWIERGVDGFRLDVIQRIGKDRLLRDSPSEPHGNELPCYDENMPVGHHYLREMRSALGPGVALLGEVWILDLEQVASYLSPRELDLAFNFPFALSPWNAEAMSAIVDEALAVIPLGTSPCWHVANHDMPREGTRYGEDAIRPSAVLLLTLPGTVVVYQGQEIGMVDGEIPPGRRVDRTGRDGCRTPLQWDGSRNAGFCPVDIEPWLPVGPDSKRRNVAEETKDPDSILALYRRLLALRRTDGALRSGSYELVGATRGSWAYLRREGEARFLIAISFGEGAVEIPSRPGIVSVATSVGREGERVGRSVSLGPWEAVVVRLD